MDKYIEQILLTKPGFKQKGLFGLCIAIMCVGIYFIMFVSFSPGVAIVVVGAFLTYMVRQSFNMEYEYLFVNGDCDISKIINKSSRKDVYSFKESDVARVLSFESEKCQNEIQVNANLVLKDFSSGESNAKDLARYMFFVNTKDGTTGVILDLNKDTEEHILDCYKKKLD